MGKPNDEAITGDVIAALAASPAVHANDIRVHTLQGLVRLEGVVDTLAEKLTAEEIAKSVQGARSVENDLAISSDGSVSDLELERRAGDHLIANGLAGLGVRVTAGTAFLMGVVPSLFVKRRAIEAAEEVQGVRGIISELEIAAEEPLDDITLANDVAEALSEDARLDFADLEVQAENGSVLITGEIASQYQLEIAATVAEAVPGVQHVENRMKAQRP